MRKRQKQIYEIKTGNGIIMHMVKTEESVAACAQSKDDIKQFEMTIILLSYGRVMPK